MHLKTSQVDVISPSRVPFSFHTNKFHNLGQRALGVYQKRERKYFSLPHVPFLVHVSSNVANVLTSPKIIITLIDI